MFVLLRSIKINGEIEIKVIMPIPRWPAVVRVRKRTDRKELGIKNLEFRIRIGGDNLRVRKVKAKARGKKVMAYS